MIIITPNDAIVRGHSSSRDGSSTERRTRRSICFFFYCCMRCPFNHLHLEGYFVFNLNILKYESDDNRGIMCWMGQMKNIKSFGLLHDKNVYRPTISRTNKSRPTWYSSFVDSTFSCWLHHDMYTLFTLLHNNCFPMTKEAYILVCWNLLYFSLEDNSQKLHLDKTTHTESKLPHGLDKSS